MKLQKSVFFFSLCLILLFCKTQLNKPGTQDSNKNSVSSENSSQITKQVNPDSLSLTDNKQNNRGRIDSLFFSKEYDLNGDGIKDSFLVFRADDSVSIKIGSHNIINVHTTELVDIFNQKGNKSPVIFFDCNRDGKTDFAVLAADSVFEDQSFLHVFTFEDSELKEFKFYYSKTKYFDNLITKYNMLLIDEVKGDIFCCTSTISSNNESGLVLNIDKYQWNKNENELFLKASKQFNPGVLKKPTKFIFEETK